MKDKNNTEKATTTRAKGILATIVHYTDQRPEDMTDLDFVKMRGVGRVLLDRIHTLMTIGICVGPYCFYHNMDGKECASPGDECEWWIKKTTQKGEETDMKKKYSVIKCATTKDDPTQWWAVWFNMNDSVGVFPTRALARMWAKYLNELEG